MEYLGFGLQLFQIVLTALLGVAYILLRDDLSKEADQRRRRFEAFFGDAERKDRFRLAAIQERFHAHHQALLLHSKMIQAGRGGEFDVVKVNQEVREFWNSASLYLYASARLEFRRAWNFMNDRELMLANVREQQDQEKHRVELDEYLSEWDAFMRFPQVIEKALELETTGIDPVYQVQREKLMNELGR
jgi:hypothetical protein